MVTEALLERVARELHLAEPIRSEIPGVEAFTILAALQLAWRHPSLSPVQRGIVEKAARDLQVAIAQRSPSAAELLELGWNRALDVQGVG